MGRLTGHHTRTRKPFWCYFPNNWDLCRRNCQKPRTYRNYAGQRASIGEQIPSDSGHVLELCPAVRAVSSAQD